MGVFVGNQYNLFLLVCVTDESRTIRIMSLAGLSARSRTPFIFLKAGAEIHGKSFVIFIDADRYCLDTTEKSLLESRFGIFFYRFMS